MNKSGLILGKEIEPGVVSQGFIDKLRALGADEKWCKAMEFDNTLREAKMALSKAREYWSYHYERVVTEGCRGYVETVCTYGIHCPWCTIHEPLNIEIDYDDTSL